MVTMNHGGMLMHDTVYLYGASLQLRENDRRTVPNEYIMRSVIHR